MKGLLAGTALVLWASVSHAACPTDEQVRALLQSMRDQQPAKSFGGDLSMEDAVCARDKLVLEMTKTRGRVIGFKAALTNAAVQKRFNYPEPVRGVLLEQMILADGAEVPAAYGARPVFEADLVVEVKHAGINDARTPLEAMAGIASVVPFIELADLVLEPGEPVTGPILVSINAGARYGVLGQKIPAEPTPEFANALAAMSVVVLDGGKEVARGPGAAVLEHPLNAVLWLIHDLSQSGIKLRGGELLSLGSFSPLLTPKAGTTVRVRYEGLPGNPEVAVRFR